MSTTSDYKYKNWVFTWNASEKNNGLVSADSIKLFLESYTEVFLFQTEVGEVTNRLHYQGCFKTKIRVRKSTLLNKFKENVCNDVQNLTINKMLGSWEQNLDYCSKPESRVENTEIVSSAELEKYEGKDLEFLDESSNWRPWQRVLYDQLFDIFPLSIATPDDREIIWVTDSFGCTGKSFWVKWLCFNNNSIIKVPFGSSTQLRCALASLGPRSVYFIDVPRTLGSDDDINAFMSVCEDLKNGFIVSAMFGRYNQLMMKPPHVIVLSNMKFPEKEISRNRWTIYNINPHNFELINSTPRWNPPKPKTVDKEDSKNIVQSNNKKGVFDEFDF